MNAVVIPDVVSDDATRYISPVAKLKPVYQIYVPRVRLG